MSFHVLLPIRDEADIIGQCLRHQLTWADRIWVFDTGSIDATWDIVREMARDEKRILPLRQDPVYFSENWLRGWMFHQARQEMRTGDWFLRADADEFHHVPPPEFVRTHLRPHETIAYHQYYDFRLTVTEASAWERGEESLSDRHRPIEERRRWFTVSEYSEPRLCRYRDSMRWPPAVAFPFNAGYLARQRLPIRHYPHRDPVQLERRCMLRAVMMADKQNRGNWTRPELHHWAEAEWRKFITPDDLPGLQFWRQGEDLPAPRQTNHLRPPHIRAAQRLVHAFGLPLLDRRRAAFPDDAEPQPIPAEVQAELKRLLSPGGS